MYTLPNGTEIPDADAWIWEVYDHCCIFHPDRFARCLHEEPPKSLNPNWEAEPWNRFCLCHTCHERIHQMGRKEAMELLVEARDMSFPNALEVLRGRG